MIKNFYCTKNQITYILKMKRVNFYNKSSIEIFILYRNILHRNIIIL